MRNNNIAEPTSAELNEFIEACQNATPEAQAEARAMLQAAAEPADDMREERAFILAAFDYGINEYMNDETKAEAHELVKAYFGHDYGGSNPILSLMSGFIIGMREGMRIAETLNAAAAEKTAAQ